MTSKSEQKRLAIQRGDYDPFARLEARNVALAEALDEARPVDERRAALDRALGPWKVPCPRACGWDTGNPALDEEGRPYTCFACGNTGFVVEARP